MSTSKTPVYSRAKAAILPFCRIFAAFGLSLLMAACATTKPAEQGLDQRAQARWDALLGGDLDTAYSYFSPGYRSSNSREDFEIQQRSRRVQWVSARVVGSRCEADACTVESEVGYKVAQPVPGIPEYQGSDTISERWVRTQGQWWYLPDN